MEAAEFKYSHGRSPELTDGEVQQHHRPGRRPRLLDRGPDGRASRPRRDSTIPALAGDASWPTRAAGCWNNSAAFLARAIAKGLDGPFETAYPGRGVPDRRAAVLHPRSDRRPANPRRRTRPSTIARRRRRPATRSRSGPSRATAGSTVLREYLDFADAHQAQYGFRCNMPLGSYFVRKDQGSLLSYSDDGDVFSIDPIRRAGGSAGMGPVPEGVQRVRRTKRNGIPLFNQSPFITRPQCEQAYGARWRRRSASG